MSGRAVSQTATLARLGFADPPRAAQLLADPALAGLVDPLDDVFSDGLPDALGVVADPDLALLSLVRLMESLRASAPKRRDLEPGSGPQVAGLIAALRHAGPARDRLLAVLGASTALGDHLVAHPEHWSAVVEAEPLTPEERVRELVAAVAAPGEHTAYDALRIGYRRQLLGIAALDLTTADPVSAVPEAAAALADLAEAALEAALEIARAEVGPQAELCEFAVIGMGKTGGRELNYVSDVDVIFVAEPRAGVEEADAIAAATALATHLMRACSTSTGQGTLWPVDAALRPEGKNGPLVRTIDSHRTYYQRWAKTWEFQALLKARPVAGDRALGQAYLDAVGPMVWQAASRENFVEDVQAMRRRVEQHVPPAEADRQLKLGPGGLRDVEFSVQLLQLVHGRSDDSLRSGTTLEALDALARAGYVGREDAATLDASYRLLRTLEHRIQLFRLRRTHLMPTAESDLRRLGRALGHRSDAASAVVAQWQQQAREVRRIHERLFYRPLLAAVARLSSSDARLAPEAARDRLAALGFRDPAGAIRHLEALTAGVSRRAAIQRTLLPVMLGWFADEADPDGGLLAFRKVSEDLGSTHWYLRLLRDEGSAAERLAHTLARSRYAADLLMGAPDSVAMLGDTTGLTPQSRTDLVKRMTAAASRQDDPDRAVRAARSIRRQELFRIAVADLSGTLDLLGVGTALTDLTAALVDTALGIAVRTVEQRLGAPLATRVLVVGMGRLGGGEVGYSSDADVLFVHDPLDDPDRGADEGAAQDQALDVVQELRRLLGSAGPDPTLGLDADLRPEGKNGPLVRSLASYRAYYERWSLTWESQALLRATPIAGDEGLGHRFEELIDPLRWPAQGLTPGEVREIRTLKARMEAERLPRGADPKAHFKLGRGGLSDVEWTVQLLQMEHAHAVPALRTTATLPALEAAVDAGVITTEHAEALRESWVLASRLRNAAVLLRGRPVDSVPSDLRIADGVSRILGGEPGSGTDLADRYRKVARRARAVTEAVFYGTA
ncbi:bifunctional [glutamine synthetase] adenylyltransferase/[glutamine synthetase]-adenylyl-L-tyrosine phosphorylase [Nostocoides sp. HKS02]|uniref:bifunctional [glutamine synthetase] adenylyltransferase/[glutamine synthetase]-adenylyl-L-tyrosine phosphorylase n=1 Tax=Nostocoides sp. HKS02 TaxID=1813880 RepID=UPI0012B50274|nr:bifunctional [glutamine synthetase] adenylyltransferase/[glutamine synthetase]-adenylyl-L-tyrosine phosphorylase [Tetrasphaera sp. HKS02]QGN59332.1 bifunctional [glutamine synthetase] adenylyltransferase/[glutamine synthetase]-adenylyl-L-tyrosine phosphorylase [Tetrasphaera sp. HKS02]